MANGLSRSPRPQQRPARFGGGQQQPQGRNQTAGGLGNAARVEEIEGGRGRLGVDDPASRTGHRLVRGMAASIPAMPDVDQSVVLQVRQHVIGAAEDAWTACLEQAQAAAGQSSDPAAVARDAEQRFTGGPGIAAGRFGAILRDETAGSSPTTRSATRALATYDRVVGRSLQAYGIQTSSAITLATTHPSGVVDSANADDNIQDVVEGTDVDRSSYGTAPGGQVELSDEILDALETLGSEFSFTVSELAGASHSATSLHYSGVAMDISELDGRYVSSRNPSVSRFMARCRQLGAVEVLGPGNRGHDTHIHAAWPRP